MSIVITAPAVTAVTAAIRGALVGDLADWTVLDGIDAQQAYLTKSLTIGGRWDPDAEAFTSQETVRVESEAHGAGRRLIESTSIDCLAYSGGGNDDFEAHRGALNDALTAVRTALDDVGSVEGSFAAAALATQTWAQVLDPAGAGVMAMFTITVTVLP
jgi:hypothetical protein